MTKLKDGTSWERHGRNGAATVVLIHGLGLNKAVWEWMIPALSNYDVITYDLYGHGQSAAPPETPSLSLFSRQLAAVLDAAGVDSAAIVGFSLGGMVCRRFAQDFPSRARALAILNSPHRRSPQAQAAVLNRVEQAAKEGPAATVDAALERWFTDDFRHANPQVMDRVRGWVMANEMAVYPTIYRVLAEGVDEITKPSPPLQLPALVLTGEDDFGNSPQMSQSIADEIDGAKVAILPGLRHMALVESPASVNQPVKEFLDQHLID